MGERIREELAVVTFDKSRHISQLWTLLPPRIPVPPEFVCQKCGWIRDWTDEEFLRWADETDHWDAVVNVQMNCKCPDSAKAQRERFEKNRRLANLPRRDDKIGPRLFSNFRLDIPEAVSIAHPVATWTKDEGAPILVLAGITGCGKTHLMEASARSLLERGLSVRYEMAGVFLDRLRASFGDNAQSVEGIFDDLDRYDRLYLDELDEASEWGTPRITRIINKRIDDGRRMMIATNHITPESMASAFDHRLASRVFDRNTGVVKVVWPRTGDYRMRKGKP